MLQSQLVLFLYLGVGIYIKKIGIIHENVKRSWIDFIIKVSLPCMVFSSFHEEFNFHTLKIAGMVLVFSLFVSYCSLILAKFAYKKYSPQKQKILQYATIVNNAGFLGLPLVESVFGAAGLLYASVYVIPNRIMMWTAGISLFTTSDKKTRFRQILLNPAMIAIYFGVLRRLCAIPIPNFLDIGVMKIGNMTSPLSMMIIGAMLVEVDYRKGLETSILYYSLIRLVILPLSVLLLCKVLHLDTLFCGVAMIMSGMPAGSTTALFAGKYQADAKYASELVIVSTLFSLLTAPMLLLCI